MSTEYPGPDHSGQYPQQSQQPVDGGKYNTAAYQPMGEYGTVVERPKQLGTLRNLTIVSLVLYVISSVVGIFTAMDETLIEESLRQSGTMTEAQIEEAMEMSMVFGLLTAIVMAVVTVILYIVVIIGVALAKNWGRILGIVLAIIGGLFMLFGLVTSFTNMDLAPGLTIASAVITVVWLAVSIWWLVVAFSAPVRNYFATPPQARV